MIYIVRPIVLAIYVKRHYKLNWKIQYEGEPIKQKWNGVAQHVSAVILDGTDNIVLTIFSGLKAVSVYSVYNLVVSGVKQLLLSMTNGIQSLIGELWAKKELDNHTPVDAGHFCKLCLSKFLFFSLGDNGICHFGNR